LRKVERACGLVQKGSEGLRPSSERFRRVKKACGLVEKGSEGLRKVQKG